MVKAEKRPRRRKEVGYVIKDRMDKSIVVRVDRLVKMPKYGKYVKRKSTFAVHDEKNEARVGDRVEIMASRRLSKNKTWRLVQVLGRAGGQ